MKIQKIIETLRSLPTELFENNTENDLDKTIDIIKAVMILNFIEMQDTYIKFANQYFIKDRKSKVMNIYKVVNSISKLRYEIAEHSVITNFDIIDDLIECINTLLSVIDNQEDKKYFEDYIISLNGIKSRCMRFI